MLSIYVIMNSVINMKIDLIANESMTLKDLLKLNHFGDKLISNLERNGLNTLKIIEKNKIISIPLPQEESDTLKEEGKLDVVYEDEYIIILNKPKNISSIPSIRHYEHNLSNILMNYYTNNHIYSKIHPVNRLDYKTSGLIIFAKHRYIHALFRNVDINKFYKATVKGLLEPKEAIINLPIYDNGTMKREDNELGKKSITIYKVIKYVDENTYVDIKLITGRTHQIRCHFAHLGHPLVGDNIYGTDKGDLMLECYKLEFIHPITKEKIEISI